MKHLLLTTIAAVVLVGCGESQPPEPPDISIHHAAYKGNIKDVKQHLAAGTDVNAKGTSGWAPLHPSAISGHKEIVELLIGKGADVNAKDDNGGTPLDMAIQNKQTESANLLRKHGGRTGADFSIDVAAKTGNIKAIKQHIAAGVDVNAKDKYGMTPLHNAVGNGFHKGHKEAVEQLIANGADVNAKTMRGETPLGVAIWVKETEIANFLRKHGGKTGEELKAEGK